MGLPEWVEERKKSVIPVEEEDIIQALSIAWEALGKIKKHQQILMNDSGLKMSTTFMISDRALRRIEDLGK